MLVYFVVGRNLRKKSSLCELLRNNIRQRKQKPSFGFKIEEHATSAKQNKELKILLSHLSQLPIFPGNQVDFFTNGHDKFERMFTDMEGASNHIHVLYYSLGAGEIGTRFRDMLIKKNTVKEWRSEYYMMPLVLMKLLKSFSRYIKMPELKSTLSPPHCSSPDPAPDQLPQS
ncbi:MAG: hypothetical protein LIP05_04125 [Tannerellaceae bacterium]|nr:hypothetical protein [Tannerellaceae bacterium]